MNVLHILRGRDCTTATVERLEAMQQVRGERDESITALWVDDLAEPAALGAARSVMHHQLAGRAGGSISGRQLRARIAELGGEVVVCHDPHLATLAAAAIGRRDEAISGAVTFASTQQLDALPEGDGVVAQAVQTAGRRCPRVLAVMPADARPDTWSDAGRPRKTTLLHVDAGQGDGDLGLLVEAVLRLDPAFETQLEAVTTSADRSHLAWVARRLGLEVNLDGGWGAVEAGLQRSDALVVMRAAGERVPAAALGAIAAERVVIAPLGPTLHAVTEASAGGVLFDDGDPVAATTAMRYFNTAGWPRRELSVGPARPRLPASGPGELDMPLQGAARPPAIRSVIR